MKKAIHIAGFVIGVIVLYALAIAALAQNPPQEAKIQSTPFLTFQRGRQSALPEAGAA